MGEAYRQMTLMTMIVMVRVKRLAMPRAKQRIIDRMPSLRGYLVSRIVPYPRSSSDGGYPPVPALCRSL